MCNYSCLCAGGLARITTATKIPAKSAREACEDEGMFDTVEYLNATRDEGMAESCCKH